MTDKELGEALLKWDSHNRASGADVREQVHKVLRRDQQRTRLLTIATVVLWFLAAIGIPLFYFLFCELVLPKFLQFMQELITHRDRVDPNVLAGAANAIFAATLRIGILTVSASVAALLLAAGGTVWLVFATRRATLREVNANLAAVAEQLRQLQPGTEAG